MIKTKWLEGCGPAREKVKMRQGNELYGKGKSHEPRLEIMFPAPLHIFSGSWVQANFSHLGFSWQLWSNVVEHLGKQEKMKMIGAGAAGLINALWALGVQNLANPFPRHLAVTKGCPGEREPRFLPHPQASALRAKL